MTDNFEQISNKPGFMKHNGGILFRKISNTEFEFKTTIDKNKLNSAGITHGGYICSIIDAGAGTAAHRASNNSPCVTISLDKIYYANNREDAKNIDFDDSFIYTEIPKKIDDRKIKMRKIYIF